MRVKRSLYAAMLCVLAASAARAADPAMPPVPSGPEIQQKLKSFQQMATVLMVAAHPDDENTALITYLARGRGYRMAYLSVTRGDGGQNLIGGEFGDELGLIRTNELLAARNLDQGRQFFTRAIDFGYSKSPDETLRIWDRDAVLGDVVRVMRTFRPDVVVARFSTQTAPGQHGHHTASAILAGEAFKLAGDPKNYPEQIKEGLAAWQPKRLFLNGGGGGIAADALDAIARHHMPGNERSAFPASDERCLGRAFAPPATAGCAATGLEIVGAEQHDGVSPSSRVPGWPAGGVKTTKLASVRQRRYSWGPKRL